MQIEDNDQQRVVEIFIRQGGKCVARYAGGICGYWPERNAFLYVGDINTDRSVLSLLITVISWIIKMTVVLPLEIY